MRDLHSDLNNDPQTGNMRQIR